MRLAQPSTELITLSVNTFCSTLYHKLIDRVTSSVTRFASLSLGLFSLLMVYSISNWDSSETVADISCANSVISPVSTSMFIELVITLSTCAYLIDHGNVYISFGDMIKKNHDQMSVYTFDIEISPESYED